MIRLSARGSRLIIYIPLCFYFIYERSSECYDSSLIYIPLCFYFIQMDDVKRIVHHQSTFHYASTLSGNEAAERRPDHIYIPLCFYFIKNIRAIFNTYFTIYIPLCFYFIPRLLRRDHMHIHLHSIMLLLYRRLRG